MKRGDCGTIVYENITENTTWGKDGSPYIIDSIIHIVNNSYLDIEPGVHVVFKNESMIISGLHYTGQETSWNPYPFTRVTESIRQIRAVGLPDERILFSSYSKNDISGHIGIGSSSTINFQYCDFYYIKNILFIASDGSSIHRCNFYRTNGFLIDEGGYDSPSTYPENNSVSECNFVNNSIAMTIYCDSDAGFGKNRFFRNNFIRNTSPILLNDNSGALWNNSHQRGNHWSDYNGSDTDEDGIGDTNLPWHNVDK